MSHPCNLCNRTFIIKQNFVKHLCICKWLHSSASQRNSEHETIHKLSEKQKDELLVDLLHNYQVLSNQLETMKKEMQNLKTKQRINMTKWLCKAKKCNKTYSKWLESISVTENHLEIVFSQDLVSGIIEAFKDEIHDSKLHNKQLPIYAFTQKLNSLYVYDLNSSSKEKSKPSEPSEPSWSLIVTDEHLKKAFNIIGAKFEKKYYVWKQSNDTLINSSDEWKEKEMMYTKKFTHDNETTRNNKLKQWLYKQIHVPFQEVNIELDCE